MPPPLILVTNDDGIDAPGIRALEQSLAPLGRIRTAAPLAEQSASSRRITLRRPIRYVDLGDGRYGIDGTPCDCVMMAVTLLLDQRPSLVVSGINPGPNLGENIYYSGTVAAAAEGAQVRHPVDGGVGRCAQGHRLRRGGPHRRGHRVPDAGRRPGPGGRAQRERARGKDSGRRRDPSVRQDLAQSHGRDEGSLEQGVLLDARGGAAPRKPRRAATMRRSGRAASRSRRSASR